MDIIESAIELANKVIELGASYEDHDGSHNCPFCFNKTYKTLGGMEDIDHDDDCAYILAQEIVDAE